MSRKVLRPLSGVLLVGLVTALIVATATPATAHYPQVDGSSRCDSQGRPWIDYRAWSWKQDPTNDGQSGNPDIGVYVEGLKVDAGVFTAENGYGFGGSILATQWAGDTVTVRAQADAPFNNGSSPGSFRETLVFVPVDCLPQEPGAVSVLVRPGACRFEGGVSRTPVEVVMEPEGAATVFIMDGSEEVVASFGVSGSLEVTPGEYSWLAIADEGFRLEGDGSGGFVARSCESQEPSVTDLAVVKAGSPRSVLEGDPVTYVITVANNGPLNEPRAVAVDTLPEKFDVLSTTPSQGSCLSEGRVISCDLGFLRVGDSATIVVLVETSRAGRYTNEVIVDGDIPDDDLANNRDTEDTDVVAVLPTTVTTSPSSPSTSQTATSPPSLNPGATTTEGLPFTGIGNQGWAGISFSLVALGGLILLAIDRRSDEPAGAWIGTTWRSSRHRNTINLLESALGDGRAAADPDR